MSLSLPVCPSLCIDTNSNQQSIEIHSRDTIATIMATPSASSPSASSSASSPSSTPLTPLQIYRLYRDRQQESIVAGEDYYLVNAQWLEALKVYAKGQGQPDAPSSPGPIDNSPLLCDTAPPSPAHLGSWVRIKPELQEKEDFVLVDHVTWQALHAAYVCVRLPRARYLSLLHASIALPPPRHDAPTTPLPPRYFIRFYSR